MKIKKLLPTQLKEGTLDLKTYRKVMKGLFEDMKKEHNAENPTEFFLKVNYEFSDRKGKMLAVLIPGKFAGAWAKYSKEELKKNKKLTRLGSCYLEEDDEKNRILKLTTKKGSAKKDMILKQLNKFSLKDLVKVELIAGAEEQEEGVTDDAKSMAADAPKSDVSAALKNVLGEIAATNKAINLKDGLNAEDLEKAEVLKGLIRKFATLLKGADEAVRAEHGDTFVKTKKLYKKLEAEIALLQADEDIDLESALADTLSAEGAGIQLSTEANKKDAIAANNHLMNEINSLVGELGLYELV